MKEMTGAVVMGEVSYAYSILFGKTERNRLFGRIRYRWEDNIKVDAKKVGWEVVNWIRPVLGMGQ
jgi:hypothetical protein